MSRRYQQGCLYREKRKAGPEVWVFRWRDGQTNRKEQIGTVEQFPTKSAARKACELLRTNINKEARTPRTMAELVAHYQKHELPNKTPYTREVYEDYITKWIIPKWRTFTLSDVRTVAVESWLSTLPLANGSRAKIRNIMSAIYSHAQRWEFFERNPITLVRQSAKREKDSELLGLRWHDCDFANEEIRLSRGIVRQNETTMKTEASRKPIPMDTGLASVWWDGVQSVRTTRMAITFLPALT
jgi:hypothetical protein